MEKLFTTELTINGRKASYEVIFENEEYVFHPRNTGKHRAFSLKREDDEWHPQTQMEEDVKEQAIASLENYLLAQH
jgi:hypothetical protein